LNVQTDIEEAVVLGLHYTPFVFINGIELKGWSAEDSLKRAVERLVAANLEPQGPDADHPMRAGDKFVADWREGIALAWPRRNPQWALGPENARVKITLFGDLLGPTSKDADNAIGQGTAGRN